MSKQSGGGTERSDQGCMRCGGTVEHNRGSRLCDACDKHIQRKMLRKGVPCDRCNSHGMVYSSIGDIQRAMNGRDTVCSDCGGSGRVAWSPDLDDVHPVLRPEVKARVK